MYKLKKEDYLKLAKIFKENFKTVNQSPFSNSIYNSEDIDWNHKPEGSYRIADHWNFNGHCETYQEVENNTHLSVGIYRNGKYDIIETFEILSGGMKDSKEYVGIDLYTNEEIFSNDLKVKFNYVYPNSFLRFYYEKGDRKDNPTFNFMYVDGYTISMDNPDFDDLLQNLPSERIKKIINNKRTKPETKFKKLKEIADKFEVYKDYQYHEVK